MLQPMSDRTTLAAFDLDGTLFDNSAQLSSTTVEVLAQLSRPNRHFVAATGRSHRSAAPRLAATDVIRWAVCDNGAVLFDLVEDSVVESHPLDRDQVGEVLSSLRRSLPGVAWAWESLAEGFFWTDTFATMSTLPKAKWQPIDDTVELPADMLKLYVAHPDFDQQQLAAQISTLAPNNLSITTSGAEFLEATAPAVTKAWMLERLSNQLGVEPVNAIAFGDNLNDLEMLRWAGIGYAMANAHPLAIEAADEVTPLPHDDHGVADVLLSVFGGG